MSFFGIRWNRFHNAIGFLFGIPTHVSYIYIYIFHYWLSFFFFECPWVCKTKQKDGTKKRSNSRSSKSMSPGGFLAPKVLNNSFFYSVFLVEEHVG